MFERGAPTPRGLIAVGLIFLMAMPMAPAGAFGSENAGDAGPRTITDDSSDLIVPSGETYELGGCHTYSNSVQINGTLKVKSYNGNDDATGTLWLQARWISIGASGTIVADGRGYGGGGGASERRGAGGFGGRLGKGGDGDGGGSNGAGGGGGSNGGIGGASSNYGTAGTAGTEGGGGTGGNSMKMNYQGGAGGTGFGGGGGGGAGLVEASGNSGDGGGGGGGGSGGATGSGFSAGGDGAGTAKGLGSSGTPAKGGDGGYAAAGTNGDTSTDMTIQKGSGGGGGGVALQMSAGTGGGGGAGGGSVALISEGDLTMGGAITTTGGGGGLGGQDRDGTGGAGGGGAGGGVMLLGMKLTVTGTINAQGRSGNVLSSDNGGTVKLFYNTDQSGTGTIQAGRTYKNGRPRMAGLTSPANNGGAPLRPEFKWKVATDPEGDSLTYHLQVSETPDFTTLALDKTGITGTSHTSDMDLIGTLFYWRVRAKDNAGFGPWSESWGFSTDTVAPVSRVNPLPAFSRTVNMTVSWNGTDDASGVAGFDIFVAEGDGAFLPWLENTCKTSGIYQGLEGHRYLFYSVAFDRGNNRETGKSVAEASTTVDASPPSSRVAPMAAFQHGTSFKMSWSGTDAVSGIKSYDVYLAADDGEFEKWQAATDKTSADFSGEDGHAYTFYSIATDNAGNVQETPGDKEMVRVNVDLTAPMISVQVGNPNYGTGPVFLTAGTVMTLESEDGFSGMNGTYYSIDGRPSKAYAAPVKESSPGHHNMTYWGVDKAGNRGENGTLWFFVDSEAPVTTVGYDGPMGDAGGKVFISAQTAISLLTADAGSGVNRTEYKLDNQAYKAYTEPLKLTTAGQHTIVYRSSDKVGNSEAETTLKVTVDITPPTTKGTASATLSNDDIEISLSATDADSGVCATYYRVVKDKATPGDFQSGTDVVIEAKEGGNADGNYTVQYYSVDVLGNKETAKELKVKIDTVVFLQLTNKAKETVGKDHYTVQGKAEPGSKVTVNSEPVTLSADGSFSVELGLESGGNKITVQAIDNAGNTASKTVSVTYNKPSTFIPGMLLPMAVAAFGMMLLLQWRKKKG